MTLEEEIKKQKAKNQLLKRKAQPQKVYNLVKDYDEINDEKPKGNPTCICKRCKKEFEQDYVPDRNTYTDWKTCKDCRSLLAEKKSKAVIKTNKEKEVSVARLPYTPYPWQVEAEEAFETHRFTVLACGNRCLLPGTFVNGCDKFVENVIEGDFVISQNGEAQLVTYVDKEDYNGDVYRVKSVGIEPIICNSNHPLMIAYGKKSNRDSKVELLNEEFVVAKELEEKFNKIGKYERLYVKMPRPKGHIKCSNWELEQYDKNYPNQIKEIQITEEIAWMIGLYVAEGCYLGRSGCKWTLNYNNPELAEKLCSILDGIGLHYNVRERKSEGTRCVIVTKSQFNRKMDEECGHGSLNKKIPHSILYNKNENILISFLMGYYAGDGYLNNNLAVLCATTVSNTLAQQLQNAWTRLGFYAKITLQQRNRNKKDGSLCNKEYLVRINDCDGINKLGYNVRKKASRETAIITDDCIYAKLESVTHKYEETKIIVVSTEDETFVANNILNHNSGKDRFTIMAGIKYFIDCLNENRAIDNPDMVPPVLWWQLAPTEKMAKQNWRELKQYFPKEWIVAWSDSAYQMETIGGGIIEVRSGYDPDSLVGVGLDLVTITEAARFKDLNIAWANLESRLNSPGRGRKIDRAGHKFGQGKAIINSSPLGKNYFYDMFCLGQKDHPNYSSVWWSAKYPWTCNPVNAELANQKVKTKFGELTYEETLRRQIGDQIFRSNYLADFLAEDGTVFKNFEEKCVVNIYDEELGLNTKAKRQEFIDNWQKVEPATHYCAGYDPSPGTTGDAPTLVIRNMNNNRIVRIFDLMGKSYEQQWDFIATICKQYNFAPVFWLRTGHTPIEGQFEKRGISELPVDENGAKKSQLVQNLEIAVENGDLKILMDGSSEAQTLIYQMNDYIGTKTNTGNIKYSNDKQKHDDFVSALYAAFSDYSAFEEKIGYCGLLGSI